MKFNQLHTAYQHFFDYLENPSGNKKKYAHTFIASFDTEWFAEGGRNTVLSYQIATTSRTKTNNIIKYMQHGKRLTLPEIVELGIRSVTTPEEFAAFKGGRAVVIMVSHNSVAEWSVLADRDEAYITRRINAVRNSPITDGHPIKLLIGDALHIDLLLFDTMLLSPASHRSLKKLSSLLGEKEKEKDTLTQYAIEHMNLFQRDEPDKFRAYALKDTEVTLRLFLILQDSLNQLVGGDKFKLYRTLASAGVRGFLLKNDWYKEYKQRHKTDKFHKAYQLVKRSYYGGRNESYFIGDTAKYEETKNKIWVDIDFSSCYPTAMGLVPKIDFDGEIDYIPYTHELTDEKTARLQKDDKIPPEIIARVRDALNTSPDAFDAALAELPQKTAWKIRSTATKVDNRLVDKWYSMWLEARQTGDTAIEKVIIPGFARVRFIFPSDTQYPSLPIRHEKFGLLYVLSGETTVTATEIILAMEAGARVEALTSLELPMARDEEGTPIRFVMDHLAELTLERSRYKAEPDNPEYQVREKLVKEFLNSFYGKFSQALNPRDVYNSSSGEMVPLGESQISEPCVATLVTTLPRTALSATLLGIERFNRGKEKPQDQITVISATADGMLVGIPATADLYDVKRFFKEKNGIPKLNNNVDKVLVPILKKLRCVSVMDEINSFLSIKQMRNSRKEMTGKDEIFEIKHLADRLISIKTRGQIGMLNSGHTSLLARFNLKPPLSEYISDPEEYRRVMDAGGIVRDTADTKWIMEHYDRIRNGLSKIETYRFITLTSFQKILKSNGTMDLVKKITNRKINMDFDWKRRLTWRTDERTISPFTVPHRNVAEMFRHRNQMEAIRRTGFVAKPEMVLHRVAVQGRSIRFRGGEPVTVARLLIRGVVQKKIPLTGEKLTYEEMSVRIAAIWQRPFLQNNHPKTWRDSDFKNAKEAKWEPGCILPNAQLEELIDELAKAFHADPQAAREAIFAVEEFEETQTRLIRQVISAATHAHTMRIEPFASLHQTGKLPTRQRIMDTFRHRISEEEIEQCIITKFIPGQLSAGDGRKLKKLFYSLGIPMKEAGECAEAVAPPIPAKKMRRKTPGEKKCTDHFTLAILQADIRVGGEEIKWLQSKLKKFGLTRNRYYELKKSGNFSPNCISDTYSNRQQIQRMAKELGRDPTPLLDVLISK